MKLYNGYFMPDLIYGTYQVSSDFQNLITTALKIGYRGIDTAAAYKNEAEIGGILPLSLEENGLQRSDLFITTKLSPSDHGQDLPLIALNKSLSSLRLDYLDLYLIHWPGVAKEPLNDSRGIAKDKRRQTWQVLENLVIDPESGPSEYRKIRSIGISNYLSRHIEEMKQYATIMPAVIQNEYHPFYADNCKLPVMESFEKTFGAEGSKIIYQAYSPLGRANSDLFNNDVINTICHQSSKSPAQILIKWSLQKGNCVVVKSCNTERIKENFDVYSWELSSNQINEINSLDGKKKYCWDPETII